MAPSRSITELIEAAFSGETLSDAEIQRIAEHVATAGFDPAATRRAGRQLEGIEWRGKVLTSESRLLAAEAHYLKHVVIQEEWPANTRLERYLRDAAVIAQDVRSGVFLSHWRGTESIGFIGRTGSMQGPRGYDWILVEYRVTTQHWVTVFQPKDSLGYLQNPGRERLQWLRHPQ